MNALNEFIFQSKYSRYNSTLGRKETWKESTQRIMDMHLSHLNDNYPNVMNDSEFMNDFIQSMEAYSDQKVFGSQRGLQFGGQPILNKHCRIFNCSASYADRLNIVKESEWVMLCGTGIGISVEKRHINKLPTMITNLSKDNEEWVIEDSIEGWSNALQQIVDYYFIDGVKYPKFDYSLIRPKGAMISGGFRAPGPEGLKKAIQKIDELLKKVYKNTKRLSPLNMADILCYCADSVLSGGLRRSAMIIIFDPDDEEMYNAKTGNWFTENPQRGRFNASAVLKRNNTSREIFDKLFQSTKQYGEPGFIWRSFDGTVYNPCCLPAWSKVLTKEGFSTIGEIQPGDIIWSETGWTTVVNKLSRGEKEVYHYDTAGGSFYSTNNHKVVSNGIKTEVGICEGIDSLAGFLPESIVEDKQTIVDGIVIGSGYLTNNNEIQVLMKHSDTRYFEAQFMDYIIEIIPETEYYGKSYKVHTTIIPEELYTTFEKKIPERFMNADTNTVLNFLKGLYSASGTVHSNYITFITAASQLRTDIQLLLSRVGISSSCRLNKPHTIGCSNGETVYSDHYCIIINIDRDPFYNFIGFIQKYKMDRIKTNRRKINRSTFKKIRASQVISTEEVFDIEVDNDTHTFWCNGFNIANCEIGMYPVDSITGKTGFQFCNLISISGKDVTTPEEFYDICKHAATIGTIQASYMKFPFLGEATENIVKEDPLIGVSIAGIMNSPEILLNGEILENGADIIKSQNGKIAKALGINPSSRTTCIKPGIFNKI